LKIFLQTQAQTVLFPIIYLYRSKEACRKQRRRVLRVEQFEEISHGEEGCEESEEKGWQEGEEEGRS